MLHYAFFSQVYSQQYVHFRGLVGVVMVYNRSLETIIHSPLLSLNIIPRNSFQIENTKKTKETQNIGETQNLFGVREDKQNPVYLAEKFPLPTYYPLLL